jgi:hypothetical protein
MLKVSGSQLGRAAGFPPSMIIFSPHSTPYQFFRWNSVIIYRKDLGITSSHAGSVLSCKAKWMNDTEFSFKSGPATIFYGNICEEFRPSFSPFWQSLFLQRRAILMLVFMVFSDLNPYLCVCLLCSAIIQIPWRIVDALLKYLCHFVLLSRTRWAWGIGCKSELDVS